ncbi:MAG: UDP-N-acetylmuramoyl-tripeptide--D-alanyl-D-alanine ligase [Actinomycetota bacterium]|nr:UDP-N-acetylmuramoyl-tripeptide--D-alanyl-D-alanine ligase [Actinomycetota bacterium]
MLALTPAEIAAVVDGVAYAEGVGHRVTRPAFVDSRCPEPDGLFVALAGVHVDGHDYAVDAVRAGAAGVLCSRRVDTTCVVVVDPVVALGRLAAYVTARLPCRVVGVTGSQGKTTTKDLLAEMLEGHGPTVASRGSYNNELGVPLTALRADEQTRYLVVEMGARGQGHIGYLAGLVRPDVALVLNVGLAHVGEFGTRQDIARAKGELVAALPGDGLAVLNADDDLVRSMAERTSAPLLWFGASSEADVRVSDVELDAQGRPHFTLTTPGGVAAVAMQLLGEHQAHNAVAAAAVAFALGVSTEAIATTLSGARPRSAARMEVHERTDGVTVVNDAYNANPDSMQAALKTLAALGAGGRRTVAVLGEMRELGAVSRESHEAIGRLAVRLGLAQLVVVGEGARPLHLGAAGAGSWDGESVFVPDVDAASRFLEAGLRAGDVVLVKASQAARLDRVATALLSPSSVIRPLGRPGDPAVGLPAATDGPGR